MQQHGNGCQGNVGTYSMLEVFSFLPVIGWKRRRPKCPCRGDPRAQVLAAGLAPALELVLAPGRAVAALTLELLLVSAVAALAPVMQHVGVPQRRQLAAAPRMEGVACLRQDRSWNGLG